jgi:hypothetical protein
VAFLWSDVEHRPTAAWRVDSQTAPKIFGGSIKTHLLVFTDSEDDVAGLTDVAKEIKGKLLTVSVDSGNDRVLGYFGITKGAFVVLCFVCLLSWLAGCCVEVAPFTLALCGRCS